MSASQGENFPNGLRGHGFEAITAYFEQRSCRACAQPYRADGIQLVREEPGSVVVKVDCMSCGHPLGIALVAVNHVQREPQPNPTCLHGRPSATPAANRPSEWTKRDVDRLGGKPKIGYDDVLSAHEFFQSLGADWAKQLPKIGSKRSYFCSYTI
jgi:hypothetical protein